MALLRPENPIQFFVLILILCATLGVINLASKFLFPYKSIKATRQIFDQDQLLNLTRICPFAESIYEIHFNETVCFNKTLYYWYIPWIQYAVWREFQEIREAKRKEKELTKLEERDYEAHLKDYTEIPVTQGETAANNKIREGPSKVVCSILAALLIISSIIAFCEVFRDMCLTRKKTIAKTIEKKYSLTEFQMNDCSRRTPELSRQVAFPSTAKVTQNLVHQTSLDRSFPRFGPEVKWPFLRRSSVPLQVMATNSSLPTNEADKFFQKQINLAAQENPLNSSLNECRDTRRKSRHFIRRH